MAQRSYEVVIVGGGVSGTALLYTLTRYTDIRSVALLEKYDRLASLNSSAQANSQTLHCGDIETNYSLPKARQVKQIASMIVRYGESVPEGGSLMRVYPKMVLAVGEAEVAALRARHEEFSEAFPYMELWERERIEEVEPAVVAADGGPRTDALLASGCEGEVSAVDYGRLAESFARRAADAEGAQVLLETPVTRIDEAEGGFRLRTGKGDIHARFVAVAAGAHSLWLAHRMGHGLEFAILPVAGSFYYIPRDMRAKVYTLQNPKLPFAALHADPDLLAPGRTRLGPTALVMPKLERYRHGTYLDFLQVLKPDRAVARALWGLFGDREIRSYVVRNMLFEVPSVRRRLFIDDARKIIPSLRRDELEYAPGVGGVRPQVIDRRQARLVLGEAVVNPGSGILFNITPSPGATTCLGNAYRNAQEITAHLGRSLDTDRLTRELLGGEDLPTAA